MSFNSSEFRNGYPHTLQTNFQKFHRVDSELSPSTRRTVNNRYVIGDFDNSGIYSGVRNLRTNTIIDQHRNVSVSSSLTQIPRFNQQLSSDSLGGSFEELERNSGHQYKESRVEHNYNNTKYSPRIIPNLENGFFEESRASYRLGRPRRSSYGSGVTSGSLLSNAAWSQLSQPSMEHFVHDITPFYSDARSDNHYLSDELERLSNELIMEGDEDPEETLV